MTGPWTLSDLKGGVLGSPKHGLKAFSCFSCGGGSSMGYKLAGFDVLGYCEIDPKMARLYDKNLDPRLRFVMPVQQFKNRALSTPDEMMLYDLDVLDGSPPCSVFSMAGNREKDWGKEREFREGQQLQRLDDLFFHFIDVARWLRPRIVVAENVKGLILGNAKGYVKEIFAGFRRAGYDCQLFLLNASRMGVPQRRERTFFVARREDLKIDPFLFQFTEPEISCEKAFGGIDPKGTRATIEQIKWWSKIYPGDAFSKGHPKGHWFNCYRLHRLKPSPTFPANTRGNAGPYLWNEPHRLSTIAIQRLQSFPDDYDFSDTNNPAYVMGMSVPPLMMQRVALEVARALLSKSRT